VEYIVRGFIFCEGAFVLARYRIVAPVRHCGHGDDVRDVFNVSDVADVGAVGSSEFWKEVVETFSAFNPNLHSHLERIYRATKQL